MEARLPRRRVLSFRRRFGSWTRRVAATSHSHQTSSSRLHARWTTQWLAWERDHDLEYKRRGAEVEVELEGASPARSSVLRARLAEVEQEKLLRYQERYEEYVRVGKAIGGLG